MQNVLFFQSILDKLYQNNEKWSWKGPTFAFYAFVAKVLSRGKSNDGLLIIVKEKIKSLPKWEKSKSISPKTWKNKNLNLKNG